MKIRPATSADIPRLMELERSSDTAAHWTEPQYQALFATDESKHLVLVTEGELAQPAAGKALLGFLVVRQIDSEWELENIVVAEAAHRCGIGTLLLDALLAEARKTNNPCVFLEVRESNAAARGLYEKAGFIEVGRRKAYYKNPAEDAVLYRWTRG